MPKRQMFVISLMYKSVALTPATSRYFLRVPQLFLIYKPEVVCKNGCTGKKQLSSFQQLLLYYSNSDLSKQPTVCINHDADVKI